MRVSKYIHSCVALEERGERLLFDPGTFTFRDGVVTADQFREVSTIVVTHDHPDHLDPDAVQAMVGFGATVVGNRQVAESLARRNIPVTVLDEGMLSVGAFTVRAMPAEHDPILADSVPPNTAILVNDRVLNPGDTVRPEPMATFAGVELLLLPVMAPWLTEVGVAAFAKALRPRAALPVHDGYAHGWFQAARYANYTAQFDRLDITFHSPIQPGDGLTIS